MKTAEINTKNNSSFEAKASFIVNERTGIVKIRMADFYPGYIGIMEYEKMSERLFEKFFSVKSNMKKPFETVTTDFKKFFPCVKKAPAGMEIIELPTDLYKQIKEYTDTNDMVIIRAQEFYPEKNYIGDEYLIIKKTLYEFLLEDGKRHHREEYFDYTWRTAFNIEAMTPAQKAAITTSSAEDICLENIRSEWIYSAMKQIDPVLAGRIYKLFYMGMSKNQIAAEEGVTKSAITQSIKSALEQLRVILMPTVAEAEICCENIQKSNTKFVELYEILKIS